jgi:hypothetical protein
MMARAARTIVGIYICSLVVAAVLYAFGARTAGTWAASPGLLLSGVALLGHVVTLDEDAKGGWSNPNNSLTVWRTSLLHLAVQFAAFLAILILVLAQS